MGVYNSHATEHTSTAFKLSKLTKFEMINSATQIRQAIKPTDILIRYGFTNSRELDKQFKIVFNKADNLDLSINKLATLEILRNNNIPVPNFYVSPYAIPKNALPVLRRRNHHHRGNDIIMVKSLQDIPKGKFYTQFIDKKREYRVHMFRGECIRIQIKVKDTTRPYTMETYINNRANGFLLNDFFKHNIKLEKHIIAICKRASKLLKLDFCAFDVIVDKNNKPYILESNTGMELSKYGRQLYGYYFRKHLGLSTRMYSLMKPNTADKLTEFSKIDTEVDEE